MTLLSVLNVSNDPAGLINKPTEPAIGLDAYDKSFNVNEIPGVAGSHSVFNNYQVFSLYNVSTSAGTEYNTDLHFDINDLVDRTVNDSQQNGAGYGSEDSNSYTLYASRTPTARQIIDHAWANSDSTKGFGAAPYSMSDFLYCKYYGKIPNNHMVTLRRYFLPCYDNAKGLDGKGQPPITQAVTYLGEEPGNKLNDILKFSFGLIWKEVEARIQEVDGVEQGAGAGLEKLLGDGGVKKFGAALALSRGKSAQDRWSGAAEKDVEWAKKAWTDEGPYWNQIYGPVNVVHKSHMRDRGMKFEHDIKLKFEYQLRSFKGINPKVAMLDLISNFLLLTYNNAKFWGGAMRYFPNYKDSVGFFGDQNAFYEGNWDEYFGSMKGELTQMVKSGQDFLQKMFSGGTDNLLASLGEGVSKIAQMALGNMQSQTRPHLLSIRSLLSGEPVGEWHLTVGNPMNPIAVMGNMLVDNCEISFGDMLGADDFPTEVTFIVSLKHGKPRDKGDIESMFNLGGGNMYMSPLNQLPSEGNTFGEAWQKGSANVERDNKTVSKSYDELVKDKTLSALPTFAEKRIKENWGDGFASKKNMAWIFGKTKAKF